jgi:hypothetical protein
MSENWTPPPPPPVTGAPVAVANNMVLAIVASALSLIFCCLPHGLIALIFALQVDKKAAAGDLQGAADAAKKAKLIAIISIVISVIGLAVSFFFGILSAILSSVQR